MQELSTNLEIEALPPIQKGLNSTGLMKIVKRNILPIASISGIITLILWFANSSVPNYSGNFQLLVEPVSSEAKFSEPSTLTNSTKNSNLSSLEMDYSTVITILKSPAMLSSIVEQIQAQYPSFTQKQLLDNLKINRLDLLDKNDISNKTKIIEVTYKESDSDLVQLVLEKTAAKYLSYSLEDRKTQISQGVEFIEEQLPKLNQRVNNLQAKLQDLREQNELIDPELKGEDLFKQIQQINIQQLETTGELKKVKALKQNLQNQLNMNPEEAVLASTLSEDSNYQQLLGKLKSLESEISTEIALFETAAPHVQYLYNKRTNLLALLNKESQRILGAKFNAKAKNSPLLKFQNSITLNMTQQLVEATNQAKLLEIQLNSQKNIQNKLEQQAKQLPKVSSQYTEIKQELAITNQTLDQLLTQRDVLRVELAQSHIPWEIVSSPQLLRNSVGNPTPLSQDSEKKFMMSLFGSLFIGIVASVLFERSRDVFYAAEDIEEQVKSPLLGLIPLSSNQDLEYDHPQFLDAFDSLYANLKFRFDETPVRSIVVSLLAQEEEETSIALYLAETVAAMGQKVLLVDANLHSPSLHSQLNLTNQQGLSELLLEQAGLEYHDVIQKSKHKANLFVLTSGQSLSDARRMLASNQMQSLNQEFYQTFDLIIYHTAPFLSFMDTSFLAAHTDGIIGVIGIGTTQKSLVMKALDQIESFKLKNLGVIATQKS